MRRVMALMALLTATAHAESPRLDTGIGLLTAPRAASAATTPALGVGIAVPVHGLLQLRADTVLATFTENNTAGRIQRVVWRSAATADVVTSRQSVALRLGIGPALELQPVRAQGDDRWGGTRVLLGARAHLGLSAPLTTRLGWRVGVGSTLTVDGPGYDALAGITIQLGPT